VTTPVLSEVPDADQREADSWVIRMTALDNEGYLKLLLPVSGLLRSAPRVTGPMVDILS
jgi:hypothetical protein